jgi:hypothetical protein
MQQSHPASGDGCKVVLHYYEVDIKCTLGRHIYTHQDDPISHQGGSGVTEETSRLKYTGVWYGVR